MIDHTAKIIIPRNSKDIQFFIVEELDDYIKRGNVTSIRKMETIDKKELSSYIIKLKRIYYFSSILPDLINNIIGDNLDHFLTYTEEVLWNKEENKTTTLLEQVNDFYNGEYNVLYKEIDENTTEININFRFELLLKNYQFFTFSTIMETIIGQIFIAEMNKFYNELNKNIENYRNQTNIKNIL